MEFNLKPFDTPIVVDKFAYVHFFEFTNKYHIRYIPVSSEDDYYDVVAKALLKKRKRAV